MAVTSASLDRRVQFLRAESVNDGYGNVRGAFLSFGPRMFASRSDVSDAEKLAAGRIEATVDSRFILRASVITRSITPADRLECEGRTFEIIGIKQTGERGRWLEFSGRAVLA